MCDLKFFKGTNYPKLHREELGGYLGQNKTKALIEECYYRLQLDRDV